MAIGTAAAIGGGALIGGVAGAMGSGSSTKYNTRQTTDIYENVQGQISGLNQRASEIQAELARVGNTPGARMGMNSRVRSLQKELDQISQQRSQLQQGVVGPSALEQAGRKGMESSFADLQKFVGMGPGDQDVQAGLSAQRGLGDLLAQMAQTGGMPGQAEINQARGFTNDIFSPQALALQQAFDDQRVQASRQAGLMNRSANDPILRAKLAQEQTRQGQMLEAQKTAFSADYAQQLPQQRLALMGQLASVRGDLASQAMKNRQAILSLGSALQTDERNFRQSIAARNSSGQQSTSSGGGIGGAISGAISGASMIGGLTNLFGGGGAAAAVGAGGQNQLSGFAADLKKTGVSNANAYMTSNTRGVPTYGMGA